jgi:DNA polymerase
MMANISPNLLQAQYLDAMGIQVWVRRNPPLSTLTETSPVVNMSIATSPSEELSRPVHTNAAEVESISTGESPVSVINVSLPPPLTENHPPVQLEATVSVTDTSLTPPLLEDQPVVQFLDWEPLKQRVAHCTACGLHQTRTQTVVGVGNQQADWMFIGEAPGEEEDAQGEPFVGVAGQLLNAMLKAIGLTREAVYITNVVKCRPPDNHNPKVEEIVHCNPFLERQIALIKPKLIVALGAVATHHLLKMTTKIGELRGQLFDYKGIPLIPIYHPAYLLRRPIEKRKAWHDLQIIYKTFAEISSTGAITSASDSIQSTVAETSPTEDP